MSTANFKPMSWTLKVGAEGRITLPLDFRKSKHIEHKDEVIVVLSEDQTYLKIYAKKDLER